MYVSDTLCYIKINVFTLEQNTETHKHSRHQSLALHIEFFGISIFKKKVSKHENQLHNKLTKSSEGAEKSTIL
jgi:hypothetical protein